MKLKTLSRILAFGVLINSVSINSFAGILSEDGRYETFAGNNITVNDVLEEEKADIKIEGKTINNIVSENQSVIIKGNIEDYYERYIQKKVSLNYPLKANTEYTISLNVKSNGYNHPPFHSIVIGQGDVDSGMGLDSWSFRLYWNKDFNFDKNSPNLGVYKVKFITPSRVEETSFDHIRFIAHNWDNFDSVIEDISIFEGDLVSDYPDKYFEGLQSSFEDQLVTQEMVDNDQEEAENLGKYKAEYNSSGKNLLNTELLNLGLMEQIANKDGQLIILNGTAPQNFTNTNVMRIELQPNRRYTMHISNEALGVYGVIRYTIDGDFNNYITCNNFSSVTFVPLEDWEDIIFYYQINDAGTSFNNVKLYAQIEEGSVATEYEPYKEESIKTFYLNSPLLQGDTIEYINGQATHVHRSGKIVFDGSDDEKWDLNSITPNQINTRSYYTSILNQYTLNSKEIPKIICDSFNVVSSHTYDYGNEGQMATQGTTARYSLMIRHTSNTVEEFKQWLSKNPVTVVYELEEQIYEPIKADLSVQLFEGTTHISNNSAIPVNIEITVDRVLNRAVEAIELVKINPTVANIALARMWTNLAKESIKKDELQNEINNITKIEDLQIEKKAVTANMDIYIKPENSLSMSLSTNKIIFEDYSSVSDLDMDNAVRITVNSSLPYDLNSYLETDIQNSDGSSKIDKDLLHIKEDSDNKYKQFLGINQKLTLKEDCEAGKNNIHDIDLRLKASSYDADIYKTVIKFEAEQK